MGRDLGQECRRDATGERRRPSSDCVARCRASQRNARLAWPTVLTACIAECPGVVEEEGTCPVDDRAAGACLDRRRPSAGRTILVATSIIVVIAAVVGALAWECREPGPCDF